MTKDFMVLMTLKPTSGNIAGHGGRVLATYRTPPSHQEVEMWGRRNPNCHIYVLSGASTPYIFPLTEGDLK